MNDWGKLRKQAEVYKEAYPVGTRIVLEHMGDDPRPIPPGTRGTVKHVDGIGTIHCDFDNGRYLGVVPGEDSFRKLTSKELEAENGAKQTSLNERISDAEALAEFLNKASTDDVKGIVEQNRLSQEL